MSKCLASSGESTCRKNKIGISYLVLSHFQGSKSSCAKFLIQRIKADARSFSEDLVKGNELQSD